MFHIQPLCTQTECPQTTCSPTKSPRGGSALALPLAGLLLLGAGLSTSACSSKDDEKQQDIPGQSLDDGVIFGEGAEDDMRAGFNGEVCAGQSAGAELAPAVLQLLVDTSGSMDQDAPGGGSKWTVTRSSMLAAIDGMPSGTTLGLVFYPNLPNDANGPCFDQRTAVGLDALADTSSQQRVRLRNAFQRQNPQGGTPTHDAYQYALKQLSQTNVAGSRFVVLITDGTPTYSLGCVGTGRIEDPVDPSPLIPQAASALATGTRTFVIGSPGSEGARSSLSRMAEAGGTARPGCSHDGPNYCHFDMTRETDLAAGLATALEAITGVALGCRYEVPQIRDGVALDPGKVNVLFTPPGGTQELLQRSDQASCSEGWQYSQNNTQIELCSSTCDRVRNSNGGLTLEFGCATAVR
ncbi:MAG: hypothetical protein RL033_7764 [Pseudomonadota bacterium]|jgi:hypothetical protein